MKRIDDLLLVKELDATFFDHAVREDLLHNAICTPSAGLEYDYERLELLGKILHIILCWCLIFLGDAFLKYLSSIYVFVTNPSLSEGSLHVVRQKIISNKSLLMHSTRVGLPAYIQSKVFPYKSWHPPNFRVYTPLKTPKETENEPAEGLETGDAKKGGMRSTDTSKGALSGEAICNTNPKDHASSNIVNEGSPILVEGILFFSPSQTKVTESADREESLSEQAGADPDIISCPDTPAIHPQPPHNTEPSRKQPSTASKKKGKSKKKTASDDQGVHWLGDKVCSTLS
jgi:endoribonuclease Dicer